MTYNFSLKYCKSLKITPFLRAGDWNVSHSFPQQCFLIHVNPNELKEGSWHADPSAFAKNNPSHKDFFSLNSIICGRTFKLIILMKHYFSSHCFKSVCKWVSLSLSMSERLINPLATNCLWWCLSEIMLFAFLLAEIRCLLNLCYTKV